MEGSKILIILKDSWLRAKISDILVFSKYVVELTDNGKRAIELVKEHRVDLIICGIDLYGIDGYGVVSMLNKFVDTAGIGLIMLLETWDQTALRRAMEIGADGYLSTGFDDAELLNQVGVRLKKKRLQQKLFLKQHFQERSMVKSGNEMFWLDEKLERLTARLFRKNQTIYNQGEYQSGLYYLLSGNIKTFISDSSGNLLITNIYGPGEYFGLQDFALGSYVCHTSKAISDAEIVSIPLKDINELIVEYPYVLKVFVKKLAESVRDMEEHALALAHASVRERVAAAIIRLAKQGGNSLDRLRVSLPRIDLANVIGIASETLSRILGDFAREGLIEKDANDILLNSIEKLRKVNRGNVR
ncbi:CRP-like cAMP-binding protein [Flavobacterium sp. W4I14]|nr:CRP-like cAMP-binding protein [Flavobacterium sp. W4I14]